MTYSSKHLFKIVFVLMCLPQVAQAEALTKTPLTLDQAVAEAQKNNPALAAQGAYADAMREIAPQLNSLPDPVLSLNALNLPVDTFSSTQENMTQMQVGMSQSFPFPGTLGLRAAVANIKADAAVYDVDELGLRLIYQVKAGWWHVLYLDRTLETVSRNQQLLRQFIRIAESKYKVGKGLQQDVLLAQLELSKLLDVAIGLEAARKQEQARLNALLNRPAAQPIVLPQGVDEVLPEMESEPVLAQQALASRPYLLSQNKAVESAQLDVDLAKKDDYPDFTLGAAYGVRRGVNPANGLDRPDFASIKLSMSMPFFSSANTHHVQQRKAELARSEFMLQDAKDAVLAEVSQALAAYEKSKEQSVLFKTGIIPQAKQTVASMLAGYQVGKVDFLNLVGSQITLYNYETRYWKVLAEANQSLARLDAAVGIVKDKENIHE